MKKIEEKILSIFKSKTCNRKNYWTFFGISFLLYIILNIIGTIMASHYIYFNYDFYKMFCFLVFMILIIYFQVKRYRDANISLYIMILLYAISIFPGINIVASILNLIILLLPTQNNNKEK